ncbi:unnamed protein product [Rotaria magnacalcarata]|uniref:Tc1-like transposase DDE domain-containing protein n=1 Tax=Rotaria magnacalcarata TaxID=392030 RepID=A0A820F853_9BILA|nr:unnamed protein product [Rotaria magnacalcarata]
MDNQSSYKKVKHLEKDEKKHCRALTTVHKALRLTWAKDHMTWNNEWHKIVCCMGGSDWIFQQDNAPIHQLKVNLTWFKSQKINVLPCPSLSPDLNPIENLWNKGTVKNCDIEILGKNQRRTTPDFDRIDAGKNI